MLTGGCACGAIRYRSDEEPIVQLLCHCGDCQRSSGSAFGAAVIVPGDRLTFTAGQPVFYEVRAQSGNAIQRGFCGQCGSPVCARKPGNALIQFLQASSLDDPARFAPTVELWTSRAQPWHPLHPDTLKFEEGPPPALIRGRIEAYFAGRDSNAAQGSGVLP